MLLANKHDFWSLFGAITLFIFLVHSCASSRLQERKDERRIYHEEKELYSSLMSTIPYENYHKELYQASIETFIRLNLIETYRYEEEYPMDSFPSWEPSDIRPYPIKLKFRKYEPNISPPRAEELASYQDMLLQEIHSSNMRFWIPIEMKNFIRSERGGLNSLDSMLAVFVNDEKPKLVVSDFVCGIKHSKEDSERGLFGHRWDVLSLFSREIHSHISYRTVREEKFVTENYRLEVNILSGNLSAFRRYGIPVEILSDSMENRIDQELEARSDTGLPNEIGEIYAITLTLNDRENNELITEYFAAYLL